MSKQMYDGGTTTREAERMLAACDVTGGAWTREMARVRQVAARYGVALDEQELALSDVRDLQVLRTRMEEPMRRRMRRRTFLYRVQTALGTQAQQ